MAATASDWGTPPQDWNHDWEPRVTQILNHEIIAKYDIKLQLEIYKIQILFTIFMKF